MKRWTRTDPETGHLLFNCWRRINVVSHRYASFLSYEFCAELHWKCWMCSNKFHSKKIPIGMPCIYRYAVEAKCPAYKGLLILLTESPTKSTPERPLTNRWDVLEFVALARPDIFGYGEPGNSIHRHKVIGWSAGH